ncbi:MAG: hypothetical protein M1457_04670 [bacterium]|nr:hypothetical protein [bacterium]
MPRFPITSSALYDYTLIVILIIVGAGVALKAGKSWGWLVVVAAVVWAYLLTQRVVGI